MKFPSLVSKLACGIAIASAASLVLAQDGYPNKPIKIVVPFSPGGGGDAVVRIISEKLGERLGQPVIIENRPGASGYIGAQAVATAAPDGYTILMGFDGSLVVAPNLIKAPFDTAADFAPITKLNVAASINETESSAMKTSPFPIRRTSAAIVLTSETMIGRFACAYSPNFVMSEIS